MKVLLVDDEKELVSTLAERLNMRGVEAQWATSAEEALNRLQTESFDVAVLDVKMPKMDGLLLKKQVQERCPAMKFIFVTGHGSSLDFETGASEVGRDYYLVKPLKIEVLIAKIKEALQR
ncbi:MAG TPA: response regulator [Desulfobacterales bacterium]|jgi:DNA-binding response OmpR family regulator|nr:response regulator [Desulfobacterales bacterium]